MRLKDYIYRMAKMNDLIVHRCTGTPEELSGTLCVSRRTVYNYLYELRSWGAVIGYDGTQRTFYYENSFVLDLHLNVKK